MNKIDTGIAELLAKQPSDSAEKDAYIAELQKTVRLLTDEVRNMDELLALLRKKQFAPSSEQTKPTEEQLTIVNHVHFLWDNIHRCYLMMLRQQRCDGKTNVSP